jgi:hypothetical protein
VVASWALVQKFVGLYPAECVGFLKANKILGTTSFGEEEMSSVTCRCFAESIDP